ncbi:hypothetical protein KFE98_12675 [bacterium SCSIO 12741]|nr:hypothetical protein KFE98_12675 [bacterium SCSIO 12741]
MLTLKNLLFATLFGILLCPDHSFAQGFEFNDQFKVVRVAIGGFKYPDDPNLDERVYIFEMEFNLQKQSIRYRKNANRSFKSFRDTIDYSYFDQVEFYQRLEYILSIGHQENSTRSLCQFWDGRFFRIELRAGSEGSDFSMKTYEFGHPKNCTYPSDKHALDEFIQQYINIADQVFPEFSNYLKRK